MRRDDLLNRAKFKTTKIIYKIENNKDNKTMVKKSIKLEVTKIIYKIEDDKDNIGTARIMNKTRG